MDVRWEEANRTCGAHLSYVAVIALHPALQILQEELETWLVSSLNDEFVGAVKCDVKQIGSQTAEEDVWSRESLDRRQHLGIGVHFFQPDASCFSRLINISPLVVFAC